MGVHFNNNFDALYECLREPFDDDEAFGENLEKVSESALYSDLAQEIKAGIEAFKKDSSGFDDDDNVKKTEDFIKLIEKLQEEQKEKLASNLVEFVANKVNVETVHATLKLKKLGFTVDQLK